MSSGSTAPLKRSTAVRRRKRQGTEPHDSSIRGASPKNVGRVASSPSEASTRQQSPHRHFDQRHGLGGSPPHASISKDPYPRQKDVSNRGRNMPTSSPLVDPGEGPGARRGATGSPSGPRRPKLHLEIPESGKSSPPIELTKPLKPPQETTKGPRAGSKPGPRGNSRFLEDLPEANNKPGKNTGSTDPGRAGEPQRSTWGRVIDNEKGRQDATSQFQEETAAAIAPFRENGVPEHGIRRYLQHNRPHKEDRNKLLSGGDD